jgi:hypothetical protein
MDASPDVGTPLAAGSLLVAGSALSAYAVTSDAFVVYTNDSTGVAAAISLAGGTSQQIATGTPGHVGIGHLISLLGAPSDTAGVAVLTDTLVPDGGIDNLPFTTWTNAGGAQTWWGPGVPAYSTMQGSSDGTRVSWFELDATGKTGSLKVSSSTFGQPYTVASGVTVPPYPVVGFGGVTGKDLIVALQTGVLEAYDTSAGMAKPITSNLSTPVYVGTIVLDPTGMHVAYVDSAGSLWIATAPSYTPVLVSSAANLQTYPIFSPDGATIYFYDSTGTVYRSPVSNPAAVTVTSGATQGVNTTSPDGMWLLAATAYASNPFPEEDVQLVSSQATGATLTAVDAIPHAFYSNFTADSSHVVEAMSPATVSGETGGIPLMPQSTLISYEIASKATSPAISTTLFAYPMPTKGTVVVFYDNPRTTSTAGQLLCDLRSVDVGTTAPKSTLIQADVECGSRTGLGTLPSNPLLSVDNKTVVYSYQGTADRAGIYAYTLP